MKEKLKSLRLRLLLPVTVMTLRQEQEKNAAGFETVSSAVTPFITAAITEARSVMADERIRSYIRLQYGPVPDLIHAPGSHAGIIFMQKSAGAKRSSASSSCGRTKASLVPCRRGSSFWTIRETIPCPGI